MECSQRILDKFNSSLGNHCLPFRLHERWDGVTLVFLCEERKERKHHTTQTDYDLSTCRCFKSLCCKNLLCLNLVLNLGRHTSGIVKGDEFVGLDVVDYGWHRLIRCYFLSGCALWGDRQEVQWCLNCFRSTRMMWSNESCQHSRTLYLIWCLHFLLILFLCVLLLLCVLHSCVSLWLNM